MKLAAGCAFVIGIVIEMLGNAIDRLDALGPRSLSRQGFAIKSSPKIASSVRKTHFTLLLFILYRHR